MTEWIMVLAAIAIVLSVIVQYRRERDDPFRLEDDFRQSSACSQTRHYNCGWPGRLLMSANGICECRCHVDQMIS